MKRSTLIRLAERGARAAPRGLFRHDSRPVTVALRRPFTPDPDVAARLAARVAAMVQP